MQRLRVRYAKRGRLRFTSHRDISRAVERAVRRAGIPVAYSAGFSPHPKISYAGAAPTGVASEAEYLEIGVTTPCDPRQVKTDLDGSLPPGLDVLDVVEAAPARWPTAWRSPSGRCGCPAPTASTPKRRCRSSSRLSHVEVERLTKKGPRRFDAREAVLRLTVPEGTGRTAAQVPGQSCVILRMVVRHMTPAVRPDDVLTGLRLVADFAPPVPPR
ncbi:TIGR03936 family radical SAM-associated protein [Nonomuraea ferruginea]